LEGRAGHEDLAAEGHACARRWRGLGTIATLDSVRAASWISTQAYAEADDAVADGRAADRQREGAGQGSCSDGRDRHVGQGGGRGQLEPLRGSRLHPTEVQGSDSRRGDQGERSDLHSV